MKCVYCGTERDEHVGISERCPRLPAQTYAAKPRPDGRPMCVHPDGTVTGAAAAIRKR